jgi:protocatechuate 3,4-dioxygenase alpha subunit
VSVPSPFGTIGPYFPSEFSNGTNDLTNNGAAQGRQITLTGTVLEEGGKPTFNTILEIWQPDSNGVFRHSLDARAPEADPNFQGWGRSRTDEQGRYTFRTVRPGAPEGRQPHINVMILAIGLTRRLVTTLFFSAAPDPVLDCVPEESRPCLIARQTGPNEYEFNIILRGETETPFFED